MIVYYAHHMSVYNTLQEERELKVIHRVFKNSVVINPNGWINSKGVNGPAIMEQCYIFVQKSDAVVFSTLEDGVIGRGVYCELKKAFKYKKRVYFLIRNALIEYYESDYKETKLINNGKDWKTYAKVKIK